jgi:hypothetical protein
LEELVTIWEVERRKKTHMNVYDHIDLEVASVEVDSRKESCKVVYKGIEFYYLDHISQSRECGVIVCDVDQSLIDILEFTSRINMEVGSTIDSLREETCRSCKISTYNPVKVMGIDKVGVHRKSIGSILDVFQLNLEVHVTISVPYKLIGIYGNLLCAFGAFFAAAFATSGGGNALWNI